MGIIRKGLIVEKGAYCRERGILARELIRGALLDREAYQKGGRIREGGY